MMVLALRTSSDTYSKCRKTIKAYDAPCLFALRHDKGRDMAKSLKLAADIGGTFTDIVLEDGPRRWSGKVLTTTAAPELGVIEGIRLVLGQSGLSARDVGVFIHGTTLATNA
jgi:Hydantoinase/oxoprolinase N-terminal region